MIVSEFTTAVSRAAAGIWDVSGQLEAQFALWWQRAAGLVAFWMAQKNSKDGSAQHRFNKRASQRDDRHHSPHDSWEQQSSVLFTNTLPSSVQTMGSGRGQVMGSHFTSIVSLSQTQFLQPLCQVSPTCLGDEELEAEQHGNTGKVQYLRCYLFRLSVRTSTTFN